jgi:CRISPR/Cas system-associated protein Cas5 (RAMP superfamily)
MSKITEKDSHYRNLEKMSSRELLININREHERDESVEYFLPRDTFEKTLKQREKEDDNHWD